MSDIKEKTEQIAEPVVETVSSVAEPVVETVSVVAEPVIETVSSIANQVSETIEKTIVEPISDYQSKVAEEEEEKNKQSRFAGFLSSLTFSSSSSTTEPPSYLMQLKTIDHLTKYPLVQQTSEFVYSCPGTKMVVGSLKPIVESSIVEKSFSLFKPCANAVDNLTDKSLNIVDKFVPSLQTQTYQTLSDGILKPVVVTKTKINDAKTSIKDFTISYGVEPVHEKIIEFRRFYNEKIYDTQGKPIIRGKFDSIVNPCNKKLENATKYYLPKGQEVPVEGFSNEIDRSFALLWNLLTRLVPAGEEKIGTIISSPIVYTKHVMNVFNENLEEEKELRLKNSFNASKKSIGVLEKEIVDFVKEKNPLKSSG